MRFLATLGFTSVVFSLLVKPSLGFADEVAELRNRVTALEKRVEVMESAAQRQGPVPLSKSTQERSSYELSQEEVTKLRTNIPMLLTHIRAVPYFTDGKAVGLRLFAIRPDSIFARIGLINGDIITKVGNKTPGDLVEFISLVTMDDAASNPRIDLSIIRERSPMSLIIQRVAAAAP